MVSCINEDYRRGYFFSPLHLIKRLCVVVASCSLNYNNNCCCCCLVSHVQLFCDPMDRGAWWATVCGISQARVLEWVAIFFSSDLSYTRTEPSSLSLLHW